LEQRIGTAIFQDLDSVAGSDDESVAAPAVRSRAVKKALTYLEAHADEAVHVGELCAETGIAWRTRQAFGTWASSLATIAGSLVSCRPPRCVVDSTRRHCERTGERSWIFGEGR